MTQRAIVASKIFDYILFGLVASTIVLVPLFIDPKLTAPVVVAKQYLIVGVAIIGLITLALRLLWERKISLVRSTLDGPIIGAVAVWLVSAVLAVSNDSWFGRNDFFVLNLGLLASAAALYFLATQVITTPERWLRLRLALVAIGAAMAFLFIVKIIFRFDIISAWFIPVWNTFDETNSNFGLWLVIIVILSAGQILKTNLTRGATIGYAAALLLSLGALFLIGFSVLWWLLLVGCILLLVIGIGFIASVRRWFVSALFALFIFIIMIIGLGSPRIGQSPVPPEGLLKAGASWSIAAKTASASLKNVFFGSGPGTFGIDFSRWRDRAFNLDPLAWSLRFNRPYASAPAWLAETGLVGSLALVGLVLYVLWQIIVAGRAARRPLSTALNVVRRVSGADYRLDVFVMGGAWLVATIGIGLLFFGPATWWLWWLLLAFTIIGLSAINKKAIYHQEASIADTPQAALSFSFIIIVGLAIMVLSGVWTARYYEAEYAYAAALRAETPGAARQKLERALERRPNVDMFYAALAQTYLSEATLAARAATPDIATVSSLLGQAVNAARRATDLSPQSVAIWEHLATMYENAAVVVPEARAWAIKSLQSASALEPSNPVLHWRLGNNLSAQGKWDEVLEQYKIALELKPDYGVAAVASGFVYEQLGQPTEALAAYQLAATRAPGDSEAIFSYGRVLYNRNQGRDRELARDLWLEIVRRDPNHANALYSLGLWYEGQGDRTTARHYYVQVSALNPNNQDLKNKLDNLKN